MNYLIAKLIKERQKAAVVLQKHYKRHITHFLFHKVLDFEKNFISIKWTQEPVPKHVQIIGSFTNPPWEKSVDLDRCPLRGTFVKYMSNLQEGTYLIKYIVDGKFKCDPTLPVIKDAAGHFNNVLEIVSDVSEAGSARDSILGRPISLSSSLIKGLRGSNKRTPRDS